MAADAIGIAVLFARPAQELRTPRQLGKRQPPWPATALPARPYSPRPGRSEPGRSEPGRSEPQPLQVVPMSSMLCCPRRRYAVFAAPLCLGLAACDTAPTPPDAHPAYAAPTASADRPALAQSAAVVTDSESNAGAPASDWCLEHGLPESQCTRCHPDLAAKFQAEGDWCQEHGYPESGCPICHPVSAPSDVATATLEAKVLQLNPPELERTIGLRTAPAMAGRAPSKVVCTARIAFDADKVADVRALIPGVVRRVHTELGARVTPHSPLFELESAGVGVVQGTLQAARQRVRAAQANLTRQLELRANDLTSARQVELAQQELASAQAETHTAEATLSMAGAARTMPSGRYTLSAPMAGTIVRRPAVVGTFATESESLATIADLSVMWALCDVPELNAGRVALGQAVDLRVDGAGPPMSGTLTWLSAEVNPRTRTVAARIELPNPGGKLRANQFAHAEITVDPGSPGVTVPRVSVQRIGEQEVVFVRTAPGVYQPRVVKTLNQDERVQVQGRVQPGDAVVTTGGVFLRTELVPGAVGAGCCEVEPRGVQ